MDESWAQPVLQWVVTPALVTGVVVGVAQLYDPQTRWSRRLKSDLAITAGLPDGPEKAAWQESVDLQAMRLREYREAFVGATLFWKWVGVAFIAFTFSGLILFPPINRPGDAFPFGPADYMMIAMGLVMTILYATFVGAGFDFLGRSPSQLILRKRLRRHNQRRRHLKLIDKERVSRARSGTKIKIKGSSLGFRTQVDAFGPWMRDPDLRGYVNSYSLASADIAGRYLADARKRGVELPEWPAVDARPRAVPW